MIQQMLAKLTLLVARMCAAVSREFGAGSRNRTHDQRFTKPLLYQLSYAGALSADCASHAAQPEVRLFYDLQVLGALARLGVSG